MVYNAYIQGLVKGGEPQKAIEIFDRMKRESCQPSTETYTLMINLYGKVNLVVQFRFCSTSSREIFRDLLFL